MTQVYSTHVLFSKSVKLHLNSNMNNASSPKLGSLWPAPNLSREEGTLKEGLLTYSDPYRYTPNTGLTQVIMLVWMGYYWPGFLHCRDFGSPGFSVSCSASGTTLGWVSSLPQESNWILNHVPMIEFEVLIDWKFRNRFPVGISFQPVRYY